MTRSSLTIAACSLMLSGCPEENPPVNMLPGPSGLASVENTCAPTDGAAFRISIALLDQADLCSAAWNDEGSHVTFEVFDGFEQDTEFSFVQDGDDFGAGRMDWVHEGESLDDFTSAILMVGELDDAGLISGSYQVVMEDGRIFEGTFDAEDCDGLPMCG